MLSKEVMKETFTVDGKLQNSPVSACLPRMAIVITMHFTFSIDIAVLDIESKCYH